MVPVLASPVLDEVVPDEVVPDEVVFTSVVAELLGSLVATELLASLVLLAGSVGLPVSATVTSLASEVPLLPLVVGAVALVSLADIVLVLPVVSPLPLSPQAAMGASATRSIRMQDKRMLSGNAGAVRLSRAARRRAFVIGWAPMRAPSLLSLPSTRRLAWTGLVWTGLACTACGEAPPPAAPKPKAAPVETPAPPPTVAPYGRVFMAASETGLVPVACHEAHVPKFSTGAACLALMPVGGEVKLDSGATAKITGSGPAACGGGQALVVQAAPEALRGHATAPADASFVEVLPPMTPDEAAKAAPGLAAQLAAVVSAEHPTLGDTKRLQLRQLAEIDLDGDRKPERLASVTLPGADEDAGPAFAALYLVPVEADARPRKLKGEPGAGVQYTVLGALDLDADGRPELWLNSYDDDGFAWSIEQVGSAMLTEIGRWRCDG